MIRGKRELLAHGLFYSGALLILRRLPQRDILLVLCYHRIGNRDEALFDPGVYSATADQLNSQVAYLKQHCSLVTLEEAMEFVNGTHRARSPHCKVLITFDDGYLDNYELAFPILQSHGVQGVFFLATEMVGSTEIPWWDFIAYKLRMSRNSRFFLDYPHHLAVDIEINGFVKSLRDVLNLYKSPMNTDHTRFINDLKEQTKGEDPAAGRRQFLNWGEAKEMFNAGMAFGSHSHSHRVLSQLSVEQQRKELTQSRVILQEQLGVCADTIAYPVGGFSSYTEQTQRLAQELGYHAAFTSHGGANRPASVQRYAISRVSVGDVSWTRFRVRTSICGLTAQYWP
ncbi:MAG: polysaccharide deacetylase family protein [Terracidiphilus sp.]|jgi:peptidoglycan/xylan/chitin deacetylase (PgdA/CDA1 family)